MEFKKQLLGLAVGLLICLGVVLFVSWWKATPNQLPDCGNEPDGPDCTRSSTIRPQSVAALRKMLEGSARDGKFEFRRTSLTNGVNVISAGLRSEEGIYTFHVFTNSLTIWFRRLGKPRTELTLGDHEFDGFVDHGLLGDPMDSGAQWFDGDLREGLEHRQTYQKLYEQHFAVIADKLQL